MVSEVQNSMACGEGARWHPQSLYLRFFKRVFDVVIATAGLVLLWPLLLICAVALRLDSRGPIFFRQARVGLNGEVFHILKLRTMVTEAHQLGPRITVANDPRITSVGRWLRRTRLDELPQLWNVLRGEMSLVGPRPELPEFVDDDDEGQRRILALRPGLTGPAALAFVDEGKMLVSQPDPEGYYAAVILPQKRAMDCKYCERITFREDLRCIIVSLGRLFGLGQR